MFPWADERKSCQGGGVLLLSEVATEVGAFRPVVQIQRLVPPGKNEQWPALIDPCKESLVARSKKPFCLLLATILPQVMFTDDLEADPVRVLEDALAFIGLDMVDSRGEKVRRKPHRSRKSTLLYCRASALSRHLIPATRVAVSTADMELRIAAFLIGGRAFPRILTK